MDLEKHLIETVIFRQWVSVDRCNLEILKKSADEYVDIFCRDLKVLLRRDFIAKQQSAFIPKTKESLSESEVAIVCDFSENYSFVLQDEAQSYHWNSSQATVHPFVVYFTEENTLQHYRFIIISERLEHNTVAAYLFQQRLIDFLKLKFENRLIFFILFFRWLSCPVQKIKRTFQVCANTKEILELMMNEFSATANGASPSFSYPLTPNVLWIPSSDIIYRVNPITSTGHVYILPVEEKIAEIMNFF
ncbi:hypothetical protein AVEN_36318-1 [Araneus ventricosus]|uniref:Uncharacterized protein n=1 Tax=Araneus ventricosus TaxID=182803 RepID=A0A4Y2GH35_ARAVE|nr:hypothetical protein AVEN_36318-1 [Araneus ventricosus]